MPAQNELRFQIDNGSGGWNTIPENEFQPASDQTYRSSGAGEITLNIDVANEEILSGQTECRLQYYDSDDTNGDGDNWATIFAGKTRSGGTLNQDGTIELQCDDLLWEYLQEKIDFTGGSSLSNTDNVAIFEEIFSGTPFTLDTGDATTESISSWGFRGARKDAAAEMSRNYGQEFYLDYDDTNYSSPGGGTHTLIYEPEGQTDSGETFEVGDETSNETITVLTWEKDRQFSKVQNVRVIGTDSNGNKVSAESGSNPPFRRVQVGYVESDSEAQTIADNLKQSESEGGRIEVRPQFIATNLINETVELKDAVSGKNIDDGAGNPASFVVKRQINRYPRNGTVLELGWTDEEGAQDLTESEKERREERSKTYPTSDTEVGEQSFSGDTGEAPSDTGTNGGVLDGSVFSLENNSQNSTQTLTSGGGSLTTSTSAPSSSTFTGDIFIITVTINVTNSTSSSYGWDVTIENLTNGDLYFFDTDVIPGNGWGAATVQAIATTNIEGDTIEAQVDNFSDQDEKTSISISVAAIFEHDHPDDIDTTDNDHGGGVNTTQHGTSGTTDSTTAQTTQEDNDQTL